jgi:hypothetical protein
MAAMATTATGLDLDRITVWAAKLNLPIDEAVTLTQRIMAANPTALADVSTTLGALKDTVQPHDQAADLVTAAMQRNWAGDSFLAALQGQATIKDRIGAALDLSGPLATRLGQAATAEAGRQLALRELTGATTTRLRMLIPPDGTPPAPETVSAARQAVTGWRDGVGALWSQGAETGATPRSAARPSPESDAGQVIADAGQADAGADHGGKRDCSGVGQDYGVNGSSGRCDGRGRSADFAGSTCQPAGTNVDGLGTCWGSPPPGCSAPPGCRPDCACRCHHSVGNCGAVAHHPGCSRPASHHLRQRPRRAGHLQHVLNGDPARFYNYGTVHPNTSLGQPEAGGAALFSQEGTPAGTIMPDGSSNRTRPDLVTKLNDDGTSNIVTGDWRNPASLHGTPVVKELANVPSTAGADADVQVATHQGHPPQPHLHPRDSLATSGLTGQRL